ncbi:MAG: hypothetical protein J4F31_10625 [Flavobacteriales bacterium]|nr:hypothetical protein [Flavobacteriales bacterium]
MAKTKNSPLVVECAWEVCNQVGGIYTVIRSKVPAAIEEWGDDYCLLGPNANPDIQAEFEEITDLRDPIGKTVEKMRGMGYEVQYGRWLVTGRPKVVLLNLQNVFNRCDALHRRMHQVHGIDVNPDHDLLNDMILWSDVNHTFFRILSKEVVKESRPIIAHFHEWMSSIPILDIKEENLPVSTVFTTHATMLGRVLAMNDPKFYDVMSKYDWKAKAKKYGVLAMTQIERCCAEKADSFTTVSEVTGKECEHLLGKKPDFVTPNGLNITRYAAFHEVQNRHERYKEKIHEFVIGHFFRSYPFDLDNTLYFFTSGRYEYRNKGYDITLKALKLLNEMMKKEKVNKTVVMFFITNRPTWSINPDVLESRGVMQEIRSNCESIQQQIGKKLFYVAAQSTEGHRLPNLNDLIDDYWKLRYRRTIQSWKTDQWPIIVTHNLVNDTDDEILNFMRDEQLVNSPLDKVKMVYHPDFISSTNPLFGLDYGQFVRGCHLGIFPSYYEPWGYTPLECVARGIPTVTSDLSGFGVYIDKMPEAQQEDGIFVLKRRKRSEAQEVKDLANSLLQFVKSTARYRMLQRNKLENFSENFDWGVLLEYYKTAYSKALKS